MPAPPVNSTNIPAAASDNGTSLTEIVKSEVVSVAAHGDQCRGPPPAVPASPAIVSPRAVAVDTVS